MDIDYEGLSKESLIKLVKLIDAAYKEAVESETKYFLLWLKSLEKIRGEHE